MYKCEISGGCPLKGSVFVQRSKNAALPILAAAVLNKGTTVIKNCPDIWDVKEMIQLLCSIGCRISTENKQITINARNINIQPLERRLTEKTRASVLMMGSLLGRAGEAVIAMPGGCAIGARPIDFHLHAFERMGAEITEEAEVLTAKTVGLHGADITLPFPSVGATENIILAAACAKGKTKIRGAAREPEIVELARCLNAMGAAVKGAGSGVIVIDGVDRLSDAVYEIGADRIVAGTYLLAAAATRGRVTVHHMEPKELRRPLKVLHKMGAGIKTGGDWVSLDGRRISKPVPFLKTAPYPGFPTDLQSQLVTVLSCVPGESLIMETIFEKRFHTGEELKKMGARIYMNGPNIHIQGVRRLYGTHLEAGDLRSCAALVIAGLMAEGITTIHHAEYLYRGYETLVEDMEGLGATLAMEKE